MAVAKREALREPAEPAERLRLVTTHKQEKVCVSGGKTTKNKQTNKRKKASAAALLKGKPDEWRFICPYLSNAAEFVLFLHFKASERDEEEEERGGGGRWLRFNASVWGVGQRKKMNVFDFSALMYTIC